MDFPFLNRFRRRRMLLVLAALGAVGAVAARAHLPPARAEPAVAEAPLELAGADVATVGEGAVARTLRLSGTLQALRQSVLTAEIEGRIDAVEVRAGDPVSAGQLLGRMDTRELESRLAEQRANLAGSRAQLELAEKTQRRNEDLLARHFISANSVDTSRSSLDASREAVKARAAQLAQAQLALSKASIRSPLKGVVAERAVEPGQHVGLNAKLFVVVDLAEMEFTANVPVSQVAAIRVGQAVSLSVEGDAEPVSGRVERIAPSADPASRMIPVYVRLANPDGRFKGGMVVEGGVRVDAAAKAATLSEQAVRREGGATFVLLLSGDEVRRRDVILGLADDAAGVVEVKSGLAAGDKVLLARVAPPAPGRRVSLANAP